MPFPNLQNFCAHVDLDDCFKPPGLQIRMPGGGVITAPNGASIPSPSDQAGKLLAAINAALMPLTPLFDIFDALLTVVKVFEAVKGLNPIAIGDALANLIPKVTKLADYMPLLSVPRMVKDILKVIICLLTALEAELAALIQAIARANLALSRGNTLGLPELTVAAQCNLEMLQFQFQALSSGTTPLNKLLTVINTLMAVGGLGSVPQLEGGDDIDAFKDSVTALRTALEVAYSVIPG